MSIGINASQAFSPNKFADLALWLEAPDLGKITESSGVVSSWKIKSVIGVGDATQGTEAEKPSTGVNTIGGKNVITFDDTDDRLVIAANAVLAGLWATGATLIAVYRSGLTTGFGRLISSDPEWKLFKVTAGTKFGLIVDFTTTNGDFRSATQYSPNTVEIVALTYDASSDVNKPVWYLNGAIISPNTGQPVGTYVLGGGSVAVGNDVTTNTNPFDGDIAEIIIYKRIIPFNEVLEAHTYLSNKYEITLAFSPLQQAGLQLWLDMADIGTIIDISGDVSGQVDKSGKGFDVEQLMGANQPRTGDNTINGHNVITFDGVNDVLFNSNFSGLDQADGYTIFMVTRPANTSNEVLLSMTVPVGATGIFLQKDTNLRFLHRFPYGFGGGDDVNNAGPTIPLVPQILTYRRDKAGNLQEVFRDSSFLKSSTVSQDAFDTATKRLNIGAFDGGTIAFTADIGEVIIYDTALSDLERGAVEQYLSTKYAIPLI